MKLIVAVDENWGIGRDGDQPFYIPEDLRRFGDLTMHRVVVMGRVTLNALPGGLPLKNRINIVISRGGVFVRDVVACSSLDQLAEYARRYNGDDVFVIGGQQIYEMLLDYCEYAYVTKIFAVAEADRTFPNLDAMENWELVSQTERKSHEGLEFCFCEYRNLRPQLLTPNKGL